MARKVLEVGQLIRNRYRILEILGRGGMGTLYKASDEARDKKIIALKTVTLNVTVGERTAIIENFQREFQLLTQLHHPNLVTVYDYGITGEEELFFTMEFVRGHNLEPGPNRLAPAETIPLVIQVSRALAYLHARNIIHGDLKPANILRSEERVKLVDFGIALETRALTARASHYTPAYAAPEVQRQQLVDYRADLYSLGALWYALLVGEPPMFMTGQDTERLIHLMLQETLEGREPFPMALIPVIGRLMALRPDNRYTSANEVITAVNEATGSTYALETQETVKSYALHGQFVGREAEMQRLETSWQRALQETSRIVLIGGESGIGKSRLVEEFAIQAQLKGTQVIRGQCVEHGGSAYQPWREILRVLTHYVEESDEALVSRLGPVLATLLPELWYRPFMAQASLPVPLDPQAAQQRLNDAVVQLLERAAAFWPTILVVEDAHWADEATLALLRFLAQVPSRAGLMIMVTYRDNEVAAGHPLLTWRSSRLERIKLGSLSPQNITRLVRSMLGLSELPGLLVERLQQMTAGNAFFVRELILSWTESGLVLQRTVTGWQVDDNELAQVSLVESIQQVIWRRLEWLTKDARQLLQWAAVIGPTFWDGAIEQVGLVSREWTHAHLEEAKAREFVIERETTAFDSQREYMFAKSVIRQVSYEHIPPNERRLYHNRAAAWLLAQNEEQILDHLGLIADQLEGAGQATAAVDYLEQAGQRAAAQFANVEAVDYFSRALALTAEDDYTRRYNLLLARDKVYDLESEREAQARNLARLEAAAEAAHNDTWRTEVLLRQTAYAVMTADYPTAIASAQAAIDLARAIEQPDREARGYLYWGQALWYQAEYEAAQAQLGQALALVGEFSPLKAESLRDLGTVSYLQGNYAGAKSYYEQSLHLCREIGSRQGESSALNGLGIICEHQGDYARSQIYHKQSLRLCREIGFRQGMGNALVDLGNIFIDLGDYEQAREHYEQALQIYREIADRQGEGLMLGNLSLLFHQLGDNEQAQQYGHKALEIAYEVGDRSGEGYCFTYLGHALVDMDRLVEAEAAYQEALTVRRELREQNLVMETLAGLARVALAQGQPVQAMAPAEEIVQHLQVNTLDGTEEPFRIHLSCYQVLQANQDPRARAILKMAYDKLQKQAAGILDDRLRRSFLQNVTAHRQIVAAWEEYGPNRTSARDQD